MHSSSPRPFKLVSALAFPKGVRVSSLCSGTNSFSCSANPGHSSLVYLAVCQVSSQSNQSTSSSPPTNDTDPDFPASRRPCTPGGRWQRRPTGRRGGPSGSGLGGEEPGEQNNLNKLEQPTRGKPLDQLNLNFNFKQNSSGGRFSDFEFRDILFPLTVRCCSLKLTNIMMLEAQSPSVPLSKSNW